MPNATVTTYRVTLTHTDYSGPLIMDLIATTHERAVSRARLSAFYSMHDERWLDARVQARMLHAGTCSQAGHERDDCV